MPPLGSSPFKCKERHAYFDASLILSKERRALLMLISVYRFPSLGMHTYILPFKASSPICVSYLSFLHSVSVSTLTTAPQKIMLASE
jgi:hypothetical protein